MLFTADAARQSRARDFAATVAAYDAQLRQCRRRVRRELADGEMGRLAFECVTGGKGLRGLLVYLAGVAAGGSAGSLNAGAAAVEILHAASLIHDDIMDRAARRRGRPALHVRVGTERALIVGDYLLVAAFGVLARSATGADRARAMDAAERLARYARQCCAGQAEEAGWSARECSEVDYLAIAEAKTGAQFAAAGTIGVTLAGGDAAQLAAAHEYGIAVGTAFQIADDVLDVVGDSAALGKPAGNSIARDRPILPLIYLAPDDANGRGSGSDARRALQARMEREGVMARVARTQERLVAQAIDALDAFPASAAKGGMAAVARQAVDRVTQEHAPLATTP
jgi:geranylgeranyl pyrophosphate synthase